MNTKTRLTIAGAVLGTVVVVPALAWGASTLVATPAGHTTTMTNATGSAAGPRAGGSSSVTATSSPSQGAPGAATPAAQPQLPPLAGAAVQPADEPSPSDTADPTPTDPSPTPPRKPNAGVLPGPGNPPAWPMLTCDPSDTPNKPETLTNCHDDDGNPYEWTGNGWHPVGETPTPSVSPTT